MRLTLLAPDILELLMAGRRPRRMNLIWFQREPAAVDREAQRQIVKRFEEERMSRTQEGRPRVIRSPMRTAEPGRRRATGNLVPWTLVKRGLKKQVITPLDAPQEFLCRGHPGAGEPRSAAQDTALMRALGLAHHWQRLLDEQRAASVAVAEAEGAGRDAVRRVMRLTLLAPKVVETP